MPESAPLPPPAPRRRVLLVEDDVGVRRSMHLMLHASGYEVRSYSSAETLLTDSSIHEASLLIADYRLPAGDGIDLRRALAAEGWRGHSVLMTAYPSIPLNEAASDSGYDIVLEKPVRTHDLLEALRA